MDLQEYFDAKKKVNEFERREKIWIEIATTKDYVAKLPEIKMVRDADISSCVFTIPDRIKERVRAAMLRELQKMIAEAQQAMKEV